MTRPPRPLRRARFASAGLVACIALLAPATAAHAADSDVTVVINPASQTVEYGQYWEVTATVDRPECLDCDPDGFEMAVQSPTNGQAIDAKIFDKTVFISSFDMSFLLPPDTYEVTGQMAYDLYTMSPSNKPGTIIVKPAALAVKAAVIPDDHQPAGAIVTAQLTGAFVDAVDECFGSTECHIPLPNGTWKITVSDPEGAVVHEEEIATKGAASRYASFYLHDVAPASDYSVDATFTPSSSDSENYTVTEATDVAFTSAEAPEAGSPDAPAVPDIEVETATGPTVPLWLAILASAIVLGLAIAAGVFWLLLRRRRNAASIDDDAVIEGELL